MSPQDMAERARLIREIEFLRSQLRLIDERELLSKTDIRVGDTIEIDWGKKRRRVVVSAITAFLEQPAFHYKRGFSESTAHHWDHPKKV